MTREEASFILANIDRRVCDDELNDALDMAISALEQNERAEEWYKLFVEKLDEQEPCEDAVSREAVLTIAGTHTLTVDETIKAIKGLPSVTPSRGWEEMTVPCENCGHDMTFKIAVCGEPSRPKGKWIRHLERDDFTDHEEEWLECSNCHTTKVEREYPLCPYCGAKMVEP